MTSSLLFAAILLPLIGGLVMLFGAQFDNRTRRILTMVTFGGPLVIAALLYSAFDPSLTGGYNFETKLNTGLDVVGIYLHLGLNGISTPLFMLAAVVGFAAGLYAMCSKAERPHLYLALLMFMQGGLMGTFASIDIFFFYFFHEFALIPTFIMIGIWGGAGAAARPSR